MNKHKQSRLINWYHAQPADNAVRNLVMTGLVALLAALTVSTAAVILQPIFLEQESLRRQASMNNLVEKIPSLAALLSESNADTFETRVVNLDTGCFETDIDITTFDARVAESDPALSRELNAPDGQKILLKRRSNHELVHLLFNDDGLQLSILPVHGPGYQSTLYAWLVLAADLNTIVALDVYEHADTPGIGSRIEDESWRRTWQDKQLFDASGEVAIRVVKNSATTRLEVDAISGATRTSNGVGNMVRFWVGEYGFGPFLTLLKTGETC